MSDERTKSANAFRTIGEVAEELGVAQHVLRFWETRFPQVQPLKRGGNRRYYRPADVVILRDIHRMLHSEGYTIKGVQRLLETKVKAPVERPVVADPVTAPIPAAEPAQAGGIDPAMLLAIRNRLAAALDAARA